MSKSKYGEIKTKRNIYLLTHPDTLYANGKADKYAITNGAPWLKRMIASLTRLNAIFYAPHRIWFSCVFVLFSFLIRKLSDCVSMYRMQDLNRCKFNLAVNSSIIIHLKLCIKQISLHFFSFNFVDNCSWYLHMK